MKTKKRLIGILLSLVMVLGLMPGMTLTAYAETTTGSITYKLDKGGLNQADDVVIDPQEFSSGFEGRQWSAGSALTVEGTATYIGANGEDSIPQTKIRNMTGVKFSNNPEAGNTLTLTFSLKDGFTFRPSRVSFQAAVYATDSGNITATVQAGENTVMIVDNGSVKRSNKNFTIQSYSGEVSGVAANSDQPLNLNFSFLNLGNGKYMGLSNLVVEGTLVKQSLAVTSVTLPATATVNKDEKVSLTATIEPSTATDQKVKWSVGGTNADAVKLYTDEACQTEVGTEATDKLTVYAKGISAGEATVTVTSNADESKNAECAVLVNGAAELPDVIKGCTYQNGTYTNVYANVPFAAADYSDLPDGTIVYYRGEGRGIVDAKGYSYKFYDKTGTEIPTDSIDTEEYSGTEMGLSADVTVYSNFVLFSHNDDDPLYIVATAPAAPVDITITPTSGDISEALAAAEEGKIVGNITINLTEGVTYTISKTIVAPASLTINGNGATIDASGLESDMIQWTEKESWTKTDVTISGLTVKGLQKSLLSSNRKANNYGDVTVDNCVVEITAASVTPFNFAGGSVALNLNLTNSTFYAPTATTTQFYSSQSGQKASSVSAVDNPIQSFKLTNNTFYNLAKSKNFFTHRQNNTTWLSYEAKGNVFVNCGKSGAVIKGMNGGADSANPTWAIDGNLFNYDGADTSALESTGDANEPVQNSVAGVVTFTDVAAGNFNGTVELSSGTLPTKLGDPRYTLTSGHTHDFTYTAGTTADTKNTITATCTADGCSLPPSTEGGTDHVATLNIAAPTMTVYGQTGDGISEAATLDGVADFNTATGLSVADTAIKYYKATKGEGDAYTRGDEITGGAPTDAGVYMAEITLTGVKTGAETTGDVAASVGYTIAPITISTVAVTEITAPVATETLDTAAATTTEHVALGGESAITWDPAAPEDGKAAYATAYKATVTAAADANYAFDENVTATVNGQTATAAKNDDGTLSIAYTFEKTDLTPVTITPTNKEADWSAEGIAIPVEGMFTITEGAGEATYSVTNGTGEGTYDAQTGKLTVTKCGTFTVKVSTAATETYAAGAETTATLTVNKANAVAATVTANTLTYTGSAQALVTVTGTPTGGTMQYALGTATEATEQYTTSIPAKTDAGTYYVWYKAKGDANHNDSAAGSVTARILAPISATVTFKVVNGKWGDETTADKTVVLNGYEGDELRLQFSDIPQVTKPDEGYEFGSGAWSPSEPPIIFQGEAMGDPITQDTTYTYTYGRKPLAELTKVPAANQLSFTGSAQALVTAGEATGGELRYSLDGTNYSATVPTGTEAKTYTVTYKVFGDENHNDTEAAQLEVRINPAGAEGAPASDSLTYTGEAQALVKGGSVTGGELQYALGTDATTAPEDGAFTAAVPTGTDAGTYFVWYRIKGDANHNDVAPACVEVKIAKAAIAPTVTLTGWTYGQSANAPSVAGNPGNGEVSYAYGSAADGAFAEAVPTGAGLWYVKATVAETANYLGGSSEPLSFAIQKAPLTVTAAAKTKVEGEADPALTYEQTGLVNGDALTGSLAREAGDAPGSYAITQGTLTAGDNYEINFTGAALTITAKPDPSGMLIATMVSEGDTSLRLTWTGASGVDGYDIYFRSCDGKKELTLLATVEGGDATGYTVTGLAANKSYSAYVRAWVEKDGGRQYVLNSSPEVHAYTANGTKKLSNPGSLTLKKSAMTVKLGKTERIKATIKTAKKGKLTNHVAKLRYISSNPSVATVSSKGKIKGVSEGSCVIYVLTTNGIYKTVSVTVDANPTKVKITKYTKSMKVGATQDLGAKVKLTPAKAIRSLSWKSSNPAVATVDANGVVTAIKKGKATITVTTSNGKKAKVTIKVK